MIEFILPDLFEAGMDYIRIQGGKLHDGDVSVSGFKHLAVPAIASTLLLPVSITLTNVPVNEDVRVLRDILERVGASVVQSGDSVTIDTSHARYSPIPDVLSSRVHGALYMIPAFLGRFGEVELGGAGGCRIGPAPSGERPIMHIVQVLERFGVQMTCSGGRLRGHTKGLQSAEIDVLHWSDDADEPNGPLVSGVTKTAILAALASSGGDTIIHHPYWKPDVTCLLELLRSTGAVIESSSRSVRIRRPISLSPFSYELLSDLGEVMTWLTCSLYTGIPSRPLRLAGRVQEGLAAECTELERMGVELRWGDRSVFCSAPVPLEPTNIVVRSHGIYSDHHPLFTLLALRASGETTIRETVWTNRFRYVHELKAIGANLAVSGATLRVRPGSLSAARRRLEAPDLRAAAILVLAALEIEGVTLLSGASHLRRGYPQLLRDLRCLGASIEEVEAWQ